VGVVVGQLERPGQRVERGSSVTITVNRGPFIIKHPDPRLIEVAPPIRKSLETQPLRPR
jgi:hypothetical protein